MLPEGPRLRVLQGVFASAISLLLLSGRVLPLDLALTAVCAAYALVLALAVVPPRPGLASFGVPPVRQLSGFLASPLFQAYAHGSLLLGLLLPGGTAAAAAVWHEEVALTRSCSYLFPLLVQILGETLLLSSSHVSVPGFTLWNIIFNGCRLVRIWDWGSSVSSRFPLIDTTSGGWQLWNQLQVSVLLVIWWINLFGFLLPVSLPYTFKCYFEKVAVK